jgi:hypothetical protein
MLDDSPGDAAGHPVGTLGIPISHRGPYRFALEASTLLPLPAWALGHYGTYPRPRKEDDPPLPLPTRTLDQYGGYPSEHATDGDPDAWLDAVGDFPPPIIPSHYASVKGEEPFESNATKPFQLHVTPNNDWYDVAKRAVSRCNRRVTGDITGAANGLAIKLYG